MGVAGVVFVVIVIALIVEPPGAGEAIGFAAVLVAMLLVILQELKKPR
jgi:hypothetical protein